jgi:hypothetical protein
MYDQDQEDYLIYLKVYLVAKVLAQELRYKC